MYRKVVAVPPLTCVRAQRRAAAEEATVGRGMAGVSEQIKCELQVSTRSLLQPLRTSQNLSLPSNLLSHLPLLDFQHGLFLRMHRLTLLPSQLQAGSAARHVSELEHGRRARAAPQAR